MSRGKAVLIFITALALFVITTSFLEFVLPYLLRTSSPDETTFGDREAIIEFIAGQPPRSFIGIVVAHFLAAVVGGLTLGLGKLPSWSVWLLGGLATLAGLANLYLLPGHPWWFWALDLVAYVPGVYIGYRWVARTRLTVAERLS